MSKVLDYDSLATQHGAITDYDALALKHGGTSEEEAPQVEAGLERPRELRTAGQVARDQAKAVLRGIPQALTGIPSMIATGVHAALTGNAGEVLNMARGMVQPVTTPLKGAIELARPGTFPNLTPESSEFEQAAEGAGAFAGSLALPFAAKGAVKALPRLSGMIPSAERAGRKFQTIRTAAKNVPVDISAAEPIIERAKELQATGSNAPAVLTKFAKRIAPTTGKFAGTKVQMQPDPMLYPEAFDFASKAGELSAAEKLAADPKMKRQIGAFAKAMKTADRQAAASIGMGDLYDQAIREYRRAKNLAEAGEVIKKWSIRAAIGATGYALGRELDILP
jgi:hypothetical protein